MTLKATLQQLKASSRSKLPATTAAIMSRTVEQLRASGLDERALGVGQYAPEFILSDFLGRQYQSLSILAKGPLVLTFYRGSW